jgi:hypothetical protein
VCDGEPTTRVKQELRKLEPLIWRFKNNTGNPPARTLSRKINLHNTKWNFEQKWVTGFKTSANENSSVVAAKTKAERKITGLVQHLKRKTRTGRCTQGDGTCTSV